MSEEKNVPEWGEVVHINGEPFVVIAVFLGKRYFNTADRYGQLTLFEGTDFDEYRPRKQKEKRND